MARRNMTQTAAAAENIPALYDMTAAEIQQIYKMFPTDPFRAITTSFKYGFVLGSRAQAAGKYGEKKK